MEKTIEEHNLLPLAEIGRVAEDSDCSVVSLYVQTHRGRIVSLEGNRTQEIRFPVGNNSKATALLINEVKDLCSKSRSGNFTYTLSMKGGNIRKVFLQRNLRKQYPIDPPCG